MKEYITKAKVIEAIEKAVAPEITTIGDYETIGVFTRESIEQIVSNLPAADVAEVRHGKWVEYPRAHYFKCSECKYTVPYRKAIFVNGNREYDYCPSCGARMDKEDEHEVSE